MNKPINNTLSPGERCAFPDAQVVKRAAMLFDRIYAPYWTNGYENVPSSLRIDIPISNYKINMVGNKLRNELKENHIKSTSAAGKTLNVFNKSQLSKPELRVLVDDVNNIIDEFFLRLYVDSLRVDGYYVTPVYKSQHRFFCGSSSRQCFGLPSRNGEYTRNC